jgi:TonB family protein
MKMKNIVTERRSPLGWCLIVSLLLHFVFLKHKLDQAELIDQAALDEKSAVEISDIPPEVFAQMMEQNQPKKKPAPEKEMQMAETEDANNREIDPDAAFLGEHNQKAQKNLRAKQIDDFRKKQGTGGKDGPQKKEAWVPPTGQIDGEDSAQESEAIDALAATPESEKKGVKRNWKTLSLQDLSVGGNGGATAATDDYLKGTEQGDRTILSTKEFKFYAYYHRIKELLRQYWKPNVERQLTRLWGKGKNVSNDELTTKVLVLLDQKGSIQKISRLASCGFLELDEAAVEAFQKAGPFPNPPGGMVDEDGFVRIRWDFILTTDSGPRIQWRTVGSAPH